MRTFTMVDDWLARRTDLTAFEKLIISKVMRYGERGCFMSYTNMAKALGTDKRILIRAVKSLIIKGWLAPLYETKFKRVLYVDYNKLAEEEPLFFAQKKGDKSAQKGDVRSPYCMIDKEREKKQLISSAAEFMRDDERTIIADKENRKQKIRNQLDLMKEGKL